MASLKGPFYQALGKNIRRAREGARITQEQLGKSVSLSRTSITNIESGKQPVPVDLLDRLCGVLGVQIADIIPKGAVGADANVTPRIRVMDPGKREWVRRVLGNETGIQQEVRANATSVRARPEEGSGTVGSTAGRRRSGPS